MTTEVLNSILYVEDEADIMEVVQMALEVVSGFTFQAYNCGYDAIEAVKTGFSPDLILLDVMMPKIDGPETLLELRKLPATATTPAIFMTAKTQQFDVSYYASLGALGVIPKPFDPMLLEMQLRQFWEFRPKPKAP